MGSYIPTTPEERRRMAEAVGVDAPDALYSSVPASIRLSDGALRMPDGISEFEAERQLTALANKNRVYSSVFRGAGAYRHYIPSVVSRVAAKEQFVTAYTPYQPELSQGVLQSIFEYQTMISELMGMDVSNASVYDGAVAAAEAVAMCRDRKRPKALISAAAHPEVLRTVGTYCFGADAPLALVPEKDGRTDLGALAALLDGETACFYCQYPNFYGVIEDMDAIEALVHGAGAKLILGANPIAAALLRSPAECGADIAVGEGQPLGMPLSFGGPYLGFMTAKQDMVRKLPGRIVGQTEDRDGRRCFVLTLQAREQHIRREKASSNICSNQALCALTAGAYMAALGADGMRQVAKLCYDKAHYLQKELEKRGFSPAYPDAPFFHEFVTDSPVPTETLLPALEGRGILGGLPVHNGILWCATEMNDRAEIDRLLAAIEEVTAK